MMSVASIISLARAVAVRAAAHELEPYAPATADECREWTRFPMPNIGSYLPTGWRRVDDVMVDKTGYGASWEPALNFERTKAWCAEHVLSHPGAGFAFIEEGEFQIVLGCFVPDDEVTGDLYQWTECSNCGEPVEEGEEWCPWCEAYLGPDTGDDEEEEEVERSDTWAEGLEAYELGRGENENPYQGGSEEYLDWDEGWLTGKRTETGRMDDEGQPNFLP